MSIESFKLLIRRPSKLNPMDREDSTINEALQTIYSHTSDSIVYMEWDNCILELNLASQIADIYSDILKMLHLIDSINDKEFDIHWGSSSFMAQWHFEKSENNLIIIKAFWTSVTGGKETLSNLNRAKDIIEIDKSVFKEEWLKLVRIMVEDLSAVGYNGSYLKDFDTSVSIIAKPL